MPTVAKEEPYAYVIGSLFHKQYCSACFKCPEKLLRCSQCKFVHFCGKKCQQILWKDHKDECANLAGCAPKVPSEVPRLVCRILAKMKRTLVTESFPNSRSITDLMSHAEDIKNDPVRRETFDTLVKVVHEFTGDSSIKTEEILEVYGKLTSNGFSITNEDMSLNIGSGLYLNMSALDHSCKPNCVIIFNGPTAHINGINSEAGGDWNRDRLRISYVELMATTKERKQQLREQYYFECQCDVCFDITRDMQMVALRCCNGQCPGYVDSGDGWFDF